MYIISEIIFTAIEGLIIIAIFSLLSNRRDFIYKKYFNLITFVTIYTVYTYWITLFLPTAIHSVIITFFTLLALNFLFNATISRSIIKMFIIIAGMLLIEIILSFAGILITGFSFDELLKNKFIIFILSCITKSLEIIITAILYKINISIPWLNDSDPYRSKYKQTLVVISTVLCFMAGTNMYASITPNNILIYNILSFIIYVVLIVMVLVAFREGSKLELLQYANDLKKENIEQLLEFNEMVAKERHEYKNHLNTIYGLCTLNKPDLNDKIKQYINKYANNCETHSISINSGNDYVDAIINVKYNKAVNNCIELLANFQEPLSTAAIDEYSVVTIISNIIENAFESVLNIEIGNKFIQIETYIEDSIYYISISNNGPIISDLEKKKIFTAGYSTKDNSLKKRGFGLSIVEAEIKKYGGNITINSSEELTEFLISFTANINKAAI